MLDELFAHLTSNDSTVGTEWSFRSSELIDMLKYNKIKNKQDLINWLEYSDHPTIKPIACIVDQLGSDSEKLKIESTRQSSFVVIWYVNRVKLDFDFKENILAMTYDEWEAQKFALILEWSIEHELRFEIFRTANGFHAVSIDEPSLGRDSMYNFEFLLKTSLKLGADPMYALFCYLPRNRYSFRLSPKFEDDPVYYKRGMVIPHHPGISMKHDPNPTINCKPSDFSHAYLVFRKRLDMLIEHTKDIVFTKFPIFKYNYRITPQMAMEFENDLKCMYIKSRL